MAVTLKGKLFARLIYGGRKTIDDVPEDLIEDTRDSYEALYGEVLE